MPGRKTKPMEPVKIRLKKNDVVKVITGRDKGKQGRVIEIDRRTGKVVVEHVMMMKRHTKPNPSKQIKGQIAGQKPVINKAKKSIASFKLREGMPIGCSVTLRGDRMYEFFDRLVNVALPRVRDFRGVSSKSFDGRGNYTLGIKDQLIFPEIDYAKVEKTKGMNVTITTTARTDAEGVALLKNMGMPFRQ